MEDPDVSCMLRFQNGDTSAFDELVQRHKKPLINFFYRFFWDRHLAEDCCQEVFYRLFKSAARYNPKARFNTFLYRIAKHYLYDQFRQKRKIPELISLDQPLSYDDCNPVDLHETISDVKSDPRRNFERKEVLRIIKAAILSLPAKYRDVFILCENQDLKYEEVAGVLAIPVGTVKSRMYKATMLLRKKLQIVKGECLCSVGKAKKN